VAAGDDAVGIGHDRAVVEEDVDVVLGGQQCTDVAGQDEVRLAGALDGLLDRGFRRVDEVPDLPADVLLPFGQSMYASTRGSRAYSITAPYAAPYPATAVRRRPASERAMDTAEPAINHGRHVFDDRVAF
jgi:hypothetical protein